MVDRGLLRNLFAVLAVMIDADGRLIPKKKGGDATCDTQIPTRLPDERTKPIASNAAATVQAPTAATSRRSPMGKPKAETVPYSEEAEKGVLASMISPYGGPEAIAAVHGAISNEYFYHPVHRQIYIRVIDLWESNRAIDMITFTQALRDAGELETVGGVGFVTELVTF